jgi:hypothetical protein
MTSRFCLTKRIRSPAFSFSRFLTYLGTVA